MSEPKLAPTPHQQMKDLASYIALRLPENLPLRGNRNEASAVILRLIRQAEFPGSNPGREAEHVASGSTEAGGLKPPSAKIVGTQAELTTLEQDIDKLGATALRIADERNRYKADAERLQNELDAVKAASRHRFTASEAESCVDVALESTGSGDGDNEQETLNYERLAEALNAMMQNIEPYKEPL
jgi:hypothetical protein